MVDTTIVGYVPVNKAGDTMSGILTLSADPTNPLEAATKQYVDAALSTGGFRTACYGATTANLNAVYNNGASGVNATLTNNGALAAFSVDGLSPGLNERILVKDQTNLFENGIYEVSVVGDGATPWVLTRTTDYDAISEIISGSSVAVEDGTVNALTTWMQIDTVATIGTDSIQFSQLTDNPAAFATTALDNLASTAVNVDILPDTDDTWNLGQEDFRWAEVYGVDYNTGETAADTMNWRVYDTGGAAYVTFLTATVGNPNTVALSNIDEVGLKTGVANPAHSEALTFYDDTEKTLSYYNDEADVTVNIGQESVIRVYNNSGGLISNGEVVYSAGAAGAENRPSIVLAQANDATTARVLGVATHDIEDGTYGYVTQFGLVRDLNTSSFSAGDYVYLSDSVAGGLTATAPTSPNFSVLIGQVLVQNASTGIIFVTALGNTGASGAGAGSATQLVINARKDSAGTINDGEAVYITGYNVGNDVILVELAQANSSATMPALGLAQGSFTNSTTGQVIISGRIAGQDTSAFSVGNALYVSDSVAGALTSTKPVANNLIQKIGIVTRSNVSNGVITISGAGRANDVPNFTAADKFWYGGTGGVVTEGDITSQARALLDDATQLAQAQTILNNVGVTAATVASGDKILGLDLDDSGNLKSFTAQSIADLGGSASGETLSKDITQANSFSVGNVIRFNGSSYVTAQADSVANAEVVGVVSAATGSDFTVVYGGYISGLSSLTSGDVYFLDPSTAGNFTNTEPTTAGQVSKPIFIAISTTEAYVFPWRGVEVGGTANVGPTTLLNFDASSGTPTINISENVSSITDSGVGDFTVNFTTSYAAADEYYPASICGGATRVGDTTGWTDKATGSIGIETGTASGNYDAPNISLIIFGTLA